MALKKTLMQRLLSVPRSATWSVKNCRISSSTSFPSSTTRTRVPPDLNENGTFLHRLLHKRAGSISGFGSGSLNSHPPVAFPVVDGLIEKLRSMDSGRDRIRLDGLMMPAPQIAERKVEGMGVEDVRKLLRLAKLEALKARLEDVKESWVGYDTFLKMCSEDCGEEEGLGFAKVLDQSGAVIVLGDMVFLHPQQVVKTIQGLIPRPATHTNESQRKELEAMEKEKAVIDKRAAELVRRELWGGLAYLVIQTAGFMRLTFWELTWDVMEPICFYVTSMYFMACYAFFLRTSKEPSFEGFFQSRFNSKQKKLMKINNFDIERYNELKKVCSPRDLLAQQGHHVPSFDPLHINSGRSEHDYAYQ